PGQPGVPRRRPGPPGTAVGTGRAGPSGTLPQGRLHPPPAGRSVGQRLPVPRARPPRRGRCVFLRRRRRGRGRGGKRGHRQLAMTCRRAAGFTLVELLVVVAVIGLASTAVVLTLPDGEATLQRQADAFGLHLRRAREEAIIGGRTVQVGADAGGYRFSRRDFGHWQALDAAPFAPRSWADGVQARSEERRVGKESGR